MDPKKCSFESMGTHFEISLWDDISDAALLDLKQELFSLADDFDKKYSRFIKTSMVWSIAQHPGRAVVDQDFMAMLQIYMDLYVPSGKRFNPLIGFSLVDMGYDDRYTLVPKPTIRPTPDLLDTITIVSDTEISTSEPVLFDFGGVGKGYFVDKIVGVLKSKGFAHFLVNGSGDMYYVGPGAVTVGLEDPRDESRAIGTYELTKGAIASSGSQKRNWGPYHHIIDPLALASPAGIVASWVSADSVVLADALATCLFLCEPGAFSRYSFEYLLINAEHKTKKSAGFTADLFT